MTLVVDASIAVRWLFPVADGDSADELARADGPLIAPDLIVAEITNAAWRLVSFDGRKPEAIATILASTGRAFDELVPCALLQERAFQIAVELRHAVYDCFYLALAEQRNCQMATADEKLVRRCAGTKFAPRVDALSARSIRRR